MQEIKIENLSTYAIFISALQAARLPGKAVIYDIKADWYHGDIVQAFLRLPDTSKAAFVMELNNDYYSYFLLTCRKCGDEFLARQDWKDDICNSCLNSSSAVA